MESKVKLFVVGSAKCGTTSLYELLLNSNSICSMDDKEPHYFGEHSAWGDVKFKSLDSYHSNINFSSGRLPSDFSTSYLYSEAAAQEIYNYNPQAKIIIMLRDPAERALSLFNHQVRSMREPILDFDKAVSEESKRISSGWDYGFHYIESGFYYKQVKRFIALFGRNNVLVVPFNKFVSGEFNSKIELFLELNEPLQVVIPKENKTGAPKSRVIQYLLERAFPMKTFLKTLFPSWLIKKIRIKNTGEKINANNIDKYKKIYSEDLIRLYELLGWDEDQWL